MPNLVGIGNSQVPTNGMLGGLAYEDSSVLDKVRSGRKNMIINGDMRICQRFSLNQANNINNGTHTYHVDRFKAYESTDGILQGEWKSINDVEAGFRYAVRYTPATSDTSLSNSQMAFISQVIELENMKHLAYGYSYAKTCTLSFYVKSNYTSTYCIALLNQGTNNRQFVTEFKISNSNTWERKEITIPGDTTGTWDADGLRIAWCLSSASNRQTSTVGSWQSSGTAYYGTPNIGNFMNNTNNTFHLTGVQFEIGEKATDFEHRFFGEELTLCQRYFETINLYGAHSNYTGGGYNRHTGEVFWKVHKRAAPTTNTPSVGNYQPGGGSGTVSISGPTVNGGVLNTGNTNSTYPDGWINSGAVLTVDAEL
tara:strand:+ start:36 stop:1139 length:1104 start_codon:yes stop_codon:yes gene_type:complete